MKRIIFTCTVLLYSFCAVAQKSDCKISIVTDEFTGKKNVFSSNIILLEKLYLGEALFGVDKEPWRITIGFFKQEEPMLVIRHETNAYKGTSVVDVLDIKFSNGSVISFDKPIEGKYSYTTLKENTHLKTFFKLSNEQLKLFADNLIVKCRVKFRDNPMEQEMQKEIVKTKAQKIQIEAKCFLDAILTSGK
jgi:predicted nucleic-acid-binding protein